MIPKGFSAKHMSAKTFEVEILSVVPKQCREHFYFGATLACNYADYRPKWPEKTAADFRIEVDWVSGDIRLSADTATVPTIRTFRDFEQLQKVLREMEIPNG